MANVILTLIIGIAVGAAIVVIIKLNFNAGWSNKEFDGTMFIGLICLAFIGTLCGTYFKEPFAKLETTKAAIDLFENLFMIITGYLFKKAVDAASGNDGSGKQQGAK